VYRAAEVAISADRPFTMYADGDPIGELPLRVRAAPAAVTVIVPRDSGAAAFATAAEGGRLAPTAAPSDERPAEA
jgi:hypothetical protein